jgi:DNA repair exonuclease SbcCD ATPase subunit
MTETTESPSASKIPIVKRRAELKRQIRQLKLNLKEKELELDKLERNLYLTTEFHSNKSDIAGRKREIQAILDNHQEYQELNAETNELRFKVEEAEDIVSNINFYQRERLVIAADRYEKAVDSLSDTFEKFSTSIQLFENAVNKFIAAKK